MRKYMNHWQIIFKNDPMVLLMVALAVIIGPIVKIIIPVMIGIIPTWIQHIVIENYYVFDLLLAAVIPFMFGFAFGLVILEELDDKVAVYLSITPMRTKGYMLSRLIIPLMGAGIFTGIVLSIFSLTSLNFCEIALLSTASIFQGLIIPLLIVSF